MPEKTHRVVKKPQISIRYLAQYMNGSERVKRSTLRECKYKKIHHVLQHKEAKIIVSKAICSGIDKPELLERADTIRNRLADNQFERELYDHNADFITRFANVSDELAFPNAGIHPPGEKLSVIIGATVISDYIHFRLRRKTKTNKIRVGAGYLSYAKGKPVAITQAEWQGAIIFGLFSLPGINHEEEAEPEHKLCVTLDAQSGLIHSAPTDSLSRFHNAEAACATIADCWDQIDPPKGAVI